VEQPEWIDTGYDLPGHLLVKRTGKSLARKAIEAAELGSQVIFHALSRAFPKSEHERKYHPIIRDGQALYWELLAEHFHNVIYGAEQFSLSDNPYDNYRAWIQTVKKHGVAGGGGGHSPNRRYIGIPVQASGGDPCC